MTKFEASNPDYAKQVQESFSKQPLMPHLGAHLLSIEAGKIVIEMPYSINITQQHGFIHAGALTAIADTACGYAALSLMPLDSEVLTVEYKMNFLSPAKGEKAIAHGNVIKAGQTITVCEADVFVITEDDQQKLCATMLATMIRR